MAVAQFHHELEHVSRLPFFAVRILFLMTMIDDEADVLPDRTLSYCMHGPYDSDDFLTAADRKRLFESRWTVSHNSSRTGYRLDGPKLEWARNDGGEGGSHPSNLVDYGYSLGGIVSIDAGCQTRLGL